MNCPDNYDLFAAHDAEQEQRRRKMPICCRCKEHIQQEYAVKIDGRWYCEDCEDDAWDKVKPNYLESTEE